jgi:hypothetical protein
MSGVLKAAVILALIVAAAVELDQAIQGLIKGS